MPDSSPGTKLVTYFVNDTESRSRLMLVEFPVGFTREQTGHYPAYEELLILDGSLKISGHDLFDEFDSFRDKYCVLKINVKTEQ